MEAAGIQCWKIPVQSVSGKNTQVHQAIRRDLSLLTGSEKKKAYLETSPCIEMSTDSPLFAPRITLIVLPSADTSTGVVATPL